MPGITYPYNLCGIKVPGYTTSSTEAEGDTAFRCQATGGGPSSFSNVSDLAFKNKHIRGRGQKKIPNNEQVETKFRSRPVRVVGEYRSEKFVGSLTLHIFNME